MATSTRFHLDRHTEISRFREMLRGESAVHILLIAAGAGMGKTALLAEFAAEAEGHPLVVVGLKRPSLTPELILDELADRLGRHNFPSYSQSRREFAAAAQVTVSGNNMNQSSIDLRLGQVSVDQVEARRSVLTGEFMGDLDRVGADPRIVLMFDIYNEANADVQGWLGGTFLTQVRGRPHVVLVVAGQEVPNVEQDYEEWFMHHTMAPFDTATVEEYLELKGLDLSRPEFDVLIDSTDGRPLAVAMAVDKMLRRRGAVQ